MYCLGDLGGLGDMSGLGGLGGLGTRAACCIVCAKNDTGTGIITVVLEDMQPQCLGTRDVLTDILVF